MNIAYSEAPFDLFAKTCTCLERSKKNKKITYILIDSYYSLCLDKKDILLGEIQACERLLKETVSENEKKIIEKEIAELKFILDLLSRVR